jgi:hypothetical protein
MRSRSRAIAEKPQRMRVRRPNDIIRIHEPQVATNATALAPKLSLYESAELRPAWVKTYVLPYANDSPDRAWAARTMQTISV